MITIAIVYSGIVLITFAVLGIVLAIFLIDKGKYHEEREYDYNGERVIKEVFTDERGFEIIAEPPIKHRTICDKPPTWKPRYGLIVIISIPFILFGSPIILLWLLEKVFQVSTSALSEGENAFFCFLGWIVGTIGTVIGAKIKDVFFPPNRVNR